jgi:hypothetical protein
MGEILVISRRYRGFLWAGLLVVANWILIAVLKRGTPYDLFDIIVLGFIVGTMLGQTTLAAAYTIFGYPSLFTRVVLAVAWLTLLAFAFSLQVSLHGGPEDVGIVIGACLFAQWLLLLLPLWGLRLRFGLRLRHDDDLVAGFNPRDRQFGIRQLIVVTALVGLFLGVGRQLVSLWGHHFDFTRGDLAIFAFLTVSAAVLSLPLVLALLMRRTSAIAIALALALIGIVTALEASLSKHFQTGGGPEIRHFISMNAFTAGIILLVLAIVRRSGYSLTRSNNV